MDKASDKEETVNTKSNITTCKESDKQSKENKIDYFKSSFEELVDHFDFENSVKNWNDFCQVKFPT
jgi:hypothetical protein